MSLDVWSPDERRALLLSVGGGRQERPLSPVQVGTLLARARDSGDSSQDIASSLHLDSTAMVGRFISLLQLPTQVQKLVGWGRQQESLNLTQAQEIARLRNEDDCIFLAEAAIESRLSGAEVRSVVQLVRGAGQPVAAAVQSTLAMRTTVERRYVAICTIHGTDLRAFLATVDRSTREAMLRDALPLSVESCTLSSTHFTITTSNQVSGIEEIERSVNAALLARLS